ncbi:MAG: T9SS type A sorting domain-containing protein [Bacteroidia bacterium]
MKNKLDLLLNEAKNQPILLKNNDVVKIINKKSTIKKNSNTKFLKASVFMIALTLITIVLIKFWFNENITNNKETVRESEVKIIENTNNKIQTYNELKPEFKIKHNKVINKNEFEESMEETQPEQPNLVDENFKFNTTNTFTLPEPNETEYIILTNDELANLGIYTNGNILKYENIVDTTTYKVTKSKITLNKAQKYFSIQVSEWGGIRTQIGDFKVKDSLQKTSKLFWPAFIENITNKETHVVEPIRDYNENKNNFIELVKPYCIPVYVNTEAKPGGKYKYDNEFIFWFSPKQEFFNALPVYIKQQWQSRFTYIELQKYNEHLIEFTQFKKVDGLQKLLNNEQLKAIQSSYIVIEPKGLKALNIDIYNKGFNYKGYKQYDNIKSKINIKVKGSYTEIKNVELNEKINENNLQIDLVAFTDENLSRNQFFYITDKETSYYKKRERDELRFLKEYKDLVPIKVSRFGVLWFRQTPYISDVINQFQVNNTVFNLKQAKLVQLKAEELERLKISFSDNGIRIPTLISDEVKIFSVYNNEYSEHEFEGIRIFDGNNGVKIEKDTVNQNLQLKLNKPITNLTPILITTTNGIGWRSYQLDVEKYLSKEEIEYMQKHQIKPNNYQQYLAAERKAKDELKNNLNLLLPILIIHPTMYNTGIIAWYKVDSTLLTKLPARISKNISISNTNNPKTLSCEFIETCKPSALNIDVNVFPNPFDDEFSFDIDLAQNQILEISLTDITGKLVKQLEKRLKLSKGTHKLSYKNLSNLKGGIYLLQFITDDGKVFAKRIVKN